MARGRPGEVESGHESTDPMAAYSARLKVMVKVLDFVKSGGEGVEGEEMLTRTHVGIICRSRGTLT